MEERLSAFATIASRDNFAQELESFGSSISLLDRQAGDVPAGSSETCYQARADGVSN